MAKSRRDTVTPRSNLTNEILFVRGFTPITTYTTKWELMFDKRFMLWYIVRGTFKGWVTTDKKVADKKLKELTGK